MYKQYDPFGFIIFHSFAHSARRRRRRVRTTSPGRTSWKKFKVRAQIRHDAAVWPAGGARNDDRPAAPRRRYRRARRLATAADQAVPDGRRKITLDSIPLYASGGDPSVRVRYGGGGCSSLNSLQQQLLQLAAVAATLALRSAAGPR